MMNKIQNGIGLLISVFVTAIILIFFVTPELLFEISLVPDTTTKGISVSNKNWAIRPDSDGVVNFNL